jgi:hypothetical protein
MRPPTAAAELPDVELSSVDEDEELPHPAPATTSRLETAASRGSERVNGLKLEFILFLFFNLD